MDKERLNILSTLVISLALIGLAAYLVTSVPGVTADNVAVIVVTAVVAKWLQQGATQSAERQAEKIQEAVASVKNDR
jgi:type III secretory pathway lipoprotein EscJ